MCARVQTRSANTIEETTTRERHAARRHLYFCQEGASRLQIGCRRRARILRAQTTFELVRMITSINDFLISWQLGQTIIPVTADWTLGIGYHDTTKQSGNPEGG